MRSLALACSLLIACSSASTPEPSAETPLEAAVPSSAVIDSSRIVSLGGDTTEVVAALGAGDRIVAPRVEAQLPDAPIERRLLVALGQADLVEVLELRAASQDRKAMQRRIISLGHERRRPNNTFINRQRGVHLKERGADAPLE